MPDSLTVEGLSKRLNLEFSYDWSNPDMSDSTFFLLVLEKFQTHLRVNYLINIYSVSKKELL